MNPASSPIRTCLAPLLACALLAAPTPAAARVTLNLGDTTLNNQVAGQQVVFTVSTDNNDEIAGVDLFIAITSATADPPPAFAITAADDNAPITGGVVTQGTGFVFDQNVDALDNIGSSASEAFLSLLAPFNVQVPASGSLIAIDVDTAGVAPGTYLLADVLSSTGFTDALGNEVPTTVTGGSITVVPEPTGLSLCLVGLGIGLRRGGRYSSFRSACSMGRLTR